MWKKIGKKIQAEGHHVEKNVIRPIAHDIRDHVLSSTPEPLQQNPNNFFPPAAPLF